MFILDGKPLPYDRAFSHDGVTYPANWLRLSTLEEKQRIGITEVPDPVEDTWDQRFYWGVDNPKDHAGLVDIWVGQVKTTAGTLLAPTDWYVTRNAENGAAIPQDVLDRRAEIRSFSNDKENAINATTSTDELVAYVTSPDFNTWSAVEPVLDPPPTDAGGVVIDSEDATPNSGGVVPVSGSVLPDSGEDTLSFD